MGRENELINALWMNPSKPRQLAAQLGWPDRTLRYYGKRLEDEGLIVRKYRLWGLAGKAYKQRLIAIEIPPLPEPTPVPWVWYRDWLYWFGLTAVGGLSFAIGVNGL